MLSQPIKCSFEPICFDFYKLGWLSLMVFLSQHLFSENNHPEALEALQAGREDPNCEAALFHLVALEPISPSSVSA